MKKVANILATFFTSNLNCCSHFILKNIVQHSEPFLYIFIISQYFCEHLVDILP